MTLISENWLKLAAKIKKSGLMIYELDYISGRIGVIPETHREGKFVFLLENYLLGKINGRPPEVFIRAYLFGLRRHLKESEVDISGAKSKG